MTQDNRWFDDGHLFAIDIADYVDDGTDPEGIVVAHLRTCRHCRQGAVNIMKSALPDKEFTVEVCRVVNFDPHAKLIWCGYPGCDKVADTKSEYEYCKYHESLLGFADDA